ncbi:hypothetical protein E1A91_A11G293700v1 [Gossypium mustelinum]|uniref:Uncharacterized protein n=2 Tax=Gossypium TaxID=3633 RepID=A0A5D2XD56_GOSMU|nr:hypothetical protein ES332_A11G309600v1 [Gossypium tomentosum]TYJ11680.1 hypothetical protein E1A91_A11G293700v1 [Gossypium mustelinum]
MFGRLEAFRYFTNCLNGKLCCAALLFRRRWKEDY